MASLAEQSMPPAELVLTANHDIPYFDSLVARAGARFPVVFFRNAATNAPANLNSAVAHCSSSVVKVLFQDDYLLGQASLSSSYAALQNSPSGWVVSAFDHIDNQSLRVIRPMTPKFTKSLVRGINRIGAPSVVIFQKERYIDCDESLKYTFDCDWYLLMSHKWGRPGVNPSLSIRIRLHDAQATHWAKRLLRHDKAVMAAKHRPIRSFERMNSVRINSCKCVVHSSSPNERRVK